MMTIFFPASANIGLACEASRKWVKEKYNIYDPVCHVANHLYTGAKVLAGHNEALDFILQNIMSFVRNCYVSFIQIIGQHIMCSIRNFYVSFICIIMQHVISSISNCCIVIMCDLQTCHFDFYCSSCVVFLVHTFFENFINFPIYSIVCLTFYLTELMKYIR